MTILTQPAESITTESLLEFLAQRIPESINLEYKESYSPRLMDSIAAMANTYGGLVLLGIAEANGLPLPDLAGVPLADMSVIVNKCWTLLDPPFAPEVVPILISEGEDRYVLAIRVDAGRVERPVFLDGRVKIRLHGRNATAGRRQVAALFAEEAGAGDYGVVVSTAGGYGARNAHALLRAEDPGLGIRLALSARVTAAGAPVLGTVVQDRLRETLDSSSLEVWLRSRTSPRHQVGAMWEREGWNTSSVVTLTREPLKSIDDSYLIEGQCVLEVRHGSRGLVTLLLGIALRPEEDELYRALILEELYLLAHSFYATALDVVAPAIFPDIVGTVLWEPRGPYLHVDPGQNKTLADYVDFAGLRQAPDSQDVGVTWLEVPYGEDVTEPVRRDQFIRNWLIKTLLDGGYTGVEAKVGTLQPPVEISAS